MSYNKQLSWKRRWQFVMKSLVYMQFDSKNDCDTNG